jgi:hypothetical protein
MKEKLPKSKDCFCCGTNNDIGLNIDFFFENNKVTAEFIPKNCYYISENIPHPGIIIGILHESMSWVASKILNTHMKLAQINVNILKTFLACEKITFTAEIISNTTWLSEVCATAVDQNNNILYKAKGKYVPNSSDYKSDYGHPLSLNS